MKLCGIYVIHVSLNDSIYIGSSSDINRRKATHFNRLRYGRHNNPKLQNTWNKYGGLAFCFDIVELCCEDDLIGREQFWIDQISNCNSAPAAGSSKGYRFTDAQRLKVSEVAKRCWKDPQYRQKMKDRKIVTGHPQSEETRKKIGQASKGKRYALGHKHSDEAKKKISEASHRMWKQRRGELPCASL